MDDQYGSSLSHVLIDGRFDCADARETLLRLIDFKIEYHRRRCLSLLERFGKSEPASERRILELEKTRARLREDLDRAMAAGTPLQIHCVVNLSPAEAPARTE